MSNTSDDDDFGYPVIDEARTLAHYRSLAPEDSDDDFGLPDTTGFIDERFREGALLLGLGARLRCPIEAKRPRQAEPSGEVISANDQPADDTNQNVEIEQPADDEPEEIEQPADDEPEGDEIDMPTNQEMDVMLHKRIVTDVKNTTPEYGRGPAGSLWKRHVRVKSFFQHSKFKRHMKTFKVQRLRFTNLQNSALPIEAIVSTLFDHFITTNLKIAKANLTTTEYFIVMTHEALERSSGSFTIGRGYYKTLNGVSILNEIAQRMISNANIRLDDSFGLEMHIINKGPFSYTTPVGSCNKLPLMDAQLKVPNHIKNDDPLCLARSIVVQKARADQDSDPTNQRLKTIYEEIRRGDRPRQKREAIQLLQDCNIPTDLPAYSIDHLAIIATHLNDYHIRLYMRNSFDRMYTATYDANAESVLEINIVLHEGHYSTFHPSRAACGTIKCKHCKKPYWKNTRHACEFKCSACKTLTCKRDINAYIICTDCNIEFKSQECYDTHRTIQRGNGSISVCERFKKCTHCFQYYNTTNFRNGATHQCGRNTYCPNCCQHVSTDHNCCWSVTTLKQLEQLKKKQAKFNVLLYDFETVVATDVSDDGEITYAEEQYVNCVSYSHLCHECFQQPAEYECRSLGCATIDTMLYRQGHDEFDVIDRFLRYLLYDDRCKAAIVMAHNGSRFDLHFILRRLLDHFKIAPDNLMMRGQKLISMTINQSDIPNTLIFKDSYLMMAQPLAALPKAYGFDELEKGTFPYLFNMPQNYSKTLDQYPPAIYYDVDSMSIRQRQQFETWYEANKHQQFVVDSEIVKYCSNDVRILKRAIAAYMKNAIEMCGWNPVVHIHTFASFSMFILRHNHLKQGQVGVIPEIGFGANDRQSPDAIKMIQWIEHIEHRELQYKLRGGEKQFMINGRTFRVDAYHEPSKTVYEILGCVIHGCPTCTNPAEKHPFEGKTNSEVYQETMSRLEAIREHQDVDNLIEIWQHEYMKNKAANKEMETFFSKVMYKGRLLPRDALHGGRTQTYRLRYTKQPGQNIRYLDFTSLYPFICAKKAAYPKGQPVVYTTGFEPIVDGQPSPYKGIVLCDLLPPTGLRYPIVGMHSKGKFVFSLCRTCGQKMKNDPCTHTADKDRFLHTTLCHEELNLAIEHGYRVLKYHEVYHWSDDKWEVGGIFKDFVRIFLKVKHEASGYPPHVKTDAEKDDYIRMIEASDGVLLDKDKIEFNPALRTLAKLQLNSAWGKFVENPNRSTTTLLKEGEQRFGDLLCDGSRVINTIATLDNSDDPIILVSHKPKIEHVRPVPYSNIAIGAITTAWGRILLWQCLNKLGDRVLYCDTDSIMFIENDDEDLLGDLRGEGLGKLTSEIPDGYEMTDFVSPASKVYSYKLVNINDPEDVRTVVKAKGITLDSKAADVVSFDTMSQQVSNFLEDIPTSLNTQRAFITRNFGTIATKILQKKLTPVMDKCMYFDDGTTLPYGFK